MQTTKAARNAETAAKAPINTAWFKGQLADKQINQRAIASSLSLDPASVSLMLRGKRRLQLDEAAALANLLGVPLDDVLFHAGIDPEAGAKSSTPIVGVVDQDGEITMKRPEGPRRVPAPQGLPGDAVALRYEGEGAMDGWVLFYVPKDAVEPDAIGRLCVIQLAPCGKGARYVRVLKRGYSRGCWTLVGMRPGEGAIENVELASAVPVVWIKAV